MRKLEDGEVKWLSKVTKRVVGEARNRRQQPGSQLCTYGYWLFLFKLFTSLAHGLLSTFQE